MKDRDSELVGTLIFDVQFPKLLGVGSFGCVVLVAQSCPTLCDAMDCSRPGSSVHGISQARILEWAAISFFMHCALELSLTLKDRDSLLSEPPHHLSLFNSSYQDLTLSSLHFCLHILFLLFPLECKFFKGKD